MISFSLSGTSIEQITAAGLIEDRIYFVEGVGTFIAVKNTTTNELELKSYDSTTLPAGAATSGEFGASGELAVESAVTGYVAAKINEAANGAISGVTFDNTNAQIKYTPIGGQETSDDEVISGLVRDFTYSNGKITLTGTGNFSKEINIPSEQFLAGVKSYNIPANGVTAPISGYFTGDATNADDVIPTATFDQLSGTHGIVFRFATQDGVTSGYTYEYTFVSIEDIVKDYDPTYFDVNSDGKLTLNTVPSGKVNAPWETFAHKATGTQGTLFTNSGTEGDLTASSYSIGAETSGSFGNNKKVAIESAVTGWVTAQDYATATDLSDGLSGKIDKVLNETGEVPQFKADGNIESTGKKVGTELSGAIASPTANTLATEAAVNGWVTDLLTFK